MQRHEGLAHPPDHRLARQACLAAQRIDPLDGAHRALVAQLLAPDTQHLHHLLRIHVIGHGDVVQHRAAGEALLRRAADLALGAGDVVERLVEGVDAEGDQRLQHPGVEEGVGIGEGHVAHQIARCIERVGDAVAGFRQHGAAAGDAADDLHAQRRGCVEVHLVAQRLEGADDDGGPFPFPEAQHRAAPAGGDLLRQDLVQRQVHRGGERGRVDDLPVVVPPAAARAEGAAHRDGHRLGTEADQRRIRPQRRADRRRDLLDVRGRRQALHRAADVVQRLGGFEEEVAGDLHIRDAAVPEFEIDDDELAALYLVFTVHVSRDPSVA